MPLDVPSWLSNLRPDWVVLGWFFWIVYQSERCSLILAFIVGLLVDVLFSDPLGLNSLLLLFLTYAGHHSLRLVRLNIGLRSSVILLILCFLVTVAKSLVLLISLDVEIQFSNLVVPPLATALWWLLFLPFLGSERSQFSRDTL